MKPIRMTTHCRERIQTRFSSWITADEVLDIVNRKMGWSFGRNNVVLKKLDRIVIVPEVSDYWDCPKGDMLIALVDIEKDDRRITNVLLRKSGEYQGKV